MNSLKIGAKIDENFPENSLGLKNYSVLESKYDQIWARLRSKDKFMIYWDGEVIRSANGNCSWSIISLMDEIKAGIWKIHSL